MKKMGLMAIVMILVLIIGMATTFAAGTSYAEAVVSSTYNNNPAYGSGVVAMTNETAYCTARNSDSSDGNLKAYFANQYGNFFSATLAPGVNYYNTHGTSIGDLLCAKASFSVYPPNDASGWAKLVTRSN